MGSGWAPKEITALKSPRQNNRGVYFRRRGCEHLRTIETNRWCPMDPTSTDHRHTASDKLAYRIDEACHALGIGRTSLYELAKTGELKLIKIAGRTLVPRSEIERLTRVDAAG